MEIQVFKMQSQVCLSLRGRLDGGTVEDLEREASMLVDSTVQGLHFNLSELEYVSSAGLAAFLKLSKTLRPWGGKLSFSGLRGEVAKVFDVTGFAAMFEVSEAPQPRQNAEQRKALTSASGKERMLLPGSLDSLATFQDFVRSYARRSEAHPEVQPTIELIVEEIVVNIIRHAYRDKPEDIEVTCSHDENLLRLEFKDSGPPFDPLSLEPPALDVSIEERKIGGLGIHLVRKLAADTAYRREGDRNVLEVGISKAIADRSNSNSA